MAVKIRLARRGKKNHAYFHIVVADSRSPRDGRFIEQIGSYNPNTNPATIVLDSEKALQWLHNGAQPTETTRRILSYEGVLLKRHLEGGVKKGAITEEVAQQKWDAWKLERDGKISAKKQGIVKANKDAESAAHSSEAKVNQERAEAIAKKRAEEAAAKAAEKAAEDAAAKAAEAPVAEEAPVVTEAPVATETPAEAPAETPEA